MGQFSNVLLAIDKAYIVQQRTLDCRPGLGGLWAYLPLLGVSVASISTSYTNGNHYDILMAVAANVSQGQTYISCKPSNTC